MSKEPGDVSGNPRLSLARDDLSTDLYKKLSEYLEARIDTHRRRNDDLSKNIESTSALRGQIKEAKAILGALSIRDNINPEIHTMRG